jgi:hypothetical protein
MQFAFMSTDNFAARLTSGLEGPQILSAATKDRNPSKTPPDSHSLRRQRAFPQPIMRKLDLRVGGSSLSSAPAAREVQPIVVKVETHRPAPRNSQGRISIL